MIIELHDTEGFSEWISQILFSTNFLKLDVILIYDLSDQMVVA